MWRGGGDMLFKTSARFYFYELNEEGQERQRMRSVANVDVSADDQAITDLANVFEALTNDLYHLIEKQETSLLAR